MKRYAKALTEQLTALGFDHIWTNSSGFLCYVHPGDPDQIEVTISPSINEQSAKTVLRRAKRLAGAATVVEKRKGQQVKERAATTREHTRRLLDGSRTQHRTLIEQQADPDRIAEAQRLIEQRERELAAIERLMVQPTQGGNAHRGRGQARHRTGRTT